MQEDGSTHTGGSGPGFRNSLEFAIAYLDYLFLRHSLTFMLHQRNTEAVYTVAMMGIVIQLLFVSTFSCIRNACCKRLGVQKIREAFGLWIKDEDAVPLRINNCLCLASFAGLCVFGLFEITAALSPNTSVHNFLLAL